MPKKIGGKELDRIVELRRNGKSYAEISRLVGRHVNSIMKVLHAHDKKKAKERQTIKTAVSVGATVSAGDLVGLAPVEPATVLEMRMWLTNSVREGFADLSAAREEDDKTAVKVIRAGIRADMQQLSKMAPPIESSLAQHQAIVDKREIAECAVKCRAKLLDGRLPVTRESK